MTAQPSADFERITAVLDRTPWKAELITLGRFLMVHDTAKLLSCTWIDDSIINVMLSLISARLFQRDPNCAKRVLLPVCYFASSLVKMGGSDNPASFSNGELERCGEHLVQYPDAEIICVVNVHSSHWTVLGIHRQKRLYHWVDEASSTSGPSVKLKKGLKVWLKKYNSSGPYQRGPDYLSGTQNFKTDTFSCGLIAINAIEKFLFTDVSLHEEAVRDHNRIVKFLDIMEFCFKVSL